MAMLRDALLFVTAMAGTLLPRRHWYRLPVSVSKGTAAFASGLTCFFLGAAVGIPGFLEHAGLNVSMANQAVLDDAMRTGAGYDRGQVALFSAISIFTFLLLTPKGWVTLYLMVTGGFRMLGAWMDEPFGDPTLTGLDTMLWRKRERRRVRDERLTRARLEGPEFADRAVTPEKAEIPGCDLVIVSSRRKPGWERGVVVYTAAACYRIGDPVERTIAGNVRTLYPLTEHKDFEAIRKSVNYDLPS